MTHMTTQPRRKPATDSAARPNRPRPERVGTSARRPLPVIRHVVLPFHSAASAPAEPGETIGGFLSRTGWATRVGKAWSFRLPTILVVNGTPVLQRVWKRLRIKAGDVVEFWSRPWGGSNSSGANTGKQVAGIVALIALAAFAPWAAAGISGALFAGSALATSVISGAIVMGGALYVGALAAPQLSRWQRWRAWFLDETCGTLFGRFA